MQKKYKRKFAKNVKKTHFTKKKYNEFSSEKAKHTYFDKLFFRIFLSSVLLLIIVLVSNYTKMDVKTSLLDHINIIKYTDKIVGRNNSSEAQTVANLELYETIDYKDAQNNITSSDYNGVNVFESGIIVKIKKYDGLYEVTIKGKNDYLYIYKGLESIDHFMYKYVNTNEILGVSHYVDNKYHFTLEITKDNKFYSLYELEDDE